MLVAEDWSEAIRRASGEVAPTPEARAAAQQVLSQVTEKAETLAVVVAEVSKEVEKTETALKVADREADRLRKAVKASEAKVPEKSSSMEDKISEPMKSKELTQEDKLDLVRQRLLLDGTDKRVVSEMINTRRALGDQSLGVFDQYEAGLKVADSLSKTCLGTRRALQALGNLSVGDRNDIILKVKGGWYIPTTVPA